MARSVRTHKPAEDALKRAEEKFAKAFRRSPMALTLTRVKDHRYVDVNETFERITGWRRSEVIGRTPFDIGIWVEPAERLRFVEHVRSDAAVQNWEVKFRCKDGRERLGLGSAELLDVDDEPCILSVIADITESRRTENALRQSEEKFSKAFRQSPAALALTNARDYCYLDVNDTFEVVTGWRRDEVIGRTPLDIQLWINPVERQEHVERLRAEGSIRNLEFRFRSKDGTEKTGLASADLIEINGEPCVLSAVMDISNRNRTEQLLREYENAIEGADEMIVVVDREYRYVIANRAFLNFWRLTRDQVLRHSVPEIVGQEVFESIVRHKLDESLEGKLVRYELSHTYPIVGQRDIFASLLPIEGAGGIDRVVCILQDVTERKQIQALLHSAEERFRTIVNSAIDAIVAVDGDDRIVLFNPAAEKMFCCAAEQAIGSSFERFIPHRFRAEHRNCGSGFYESGLSSRIAGKLGTVLAVRDNGEEFPIEASISRDNFQGKALVTIIIRDVTERRRTEEVLQAREQDLRLAVEAGRMYVFQWDPSSDTIRRSREAVAILGTEQLLDSTRIEWLKYIHADDREKVGNSFRTITHQHPTSQVIYRMNRPDGSELWLEKRIRGIFDDRGNLVRAIGVVGDITARKQADDALRKSEERFRRLVEHIGDAVIVDDVAGHLVFANQQFLNLFGFRQEQLTDLRLEDYVAPEYREELRNLHERRMRGENVATHFEYEGVRSDGERIWLEVDVVPVRDDSGQLVGTQSAIRDIGNRKRALDALNESESRFRHLVESANDWVWEVDAEGVYIYAGPQCREILGYEPEEILGKTPFDLMPADEATRIRSLFTAIAAERKSFRGLENINLHKSGRLVVLETNGAAVVDERGRYRGYRGMDRDITERKRSDLALRESEERFRLVANTAPVMIWMAGPDKGCYYFNQRWLQFTGRPIEKELGNGWADNVHAEDRGACLATYAEAFENRQPFDIQYRLRRHDGQYRWIRDIGVPRVENDGCFAGYIGSCSDITERKRAEEALASMSRRLIQAHEEERTWIARELHDDINQRLALLAIEVGKLDQHLPTSATKCHADIHELRNHIFEISKDVQALSHRLHSSKLEYLGIVAAATSFCRELSDQYKVRIDFTHRDIPHDVSTEVALALFRVLQEALQNAVKHSQAREFTAELSGTGNEIHLIVADNGVGFNPGEIRSGRGIGLISMRERLQLVNGTVAVESRPGHGTTIRVRVPFTSQSHSVAG